MALSMRNNEICSSVVRHHFQPGMEELVSFAQCLIEDRTDQSTQRNMKWHIARASQEMNEALEELKGGLSTIDAKSAELVAQKKHLKYKRQAQSQQLSNLRHQLDSHKNLESRSREMLETAQRHLRVMQQEVSQKEKEIEESERLRNVGIGLMFIPFVGTIVGGILAVCAQTALDEAQRAKRDAEAEVNRHSKDVDQHSTETRRLQDLVREAESNIQTSEWRLSCIATEKQQLAFQQAQVVNFQNTLRKCVTFLAVLAGKVDTAEFLCSEVVIFSELERILEEILYHVFPLMGQGKGTGVMALSSAKIRGLIRRLKCARENLSLQGPQRGRAIDF